MDVGGKDVVLSMAAIADDGTFESAQQMLTRIAEWTASSGAAVVGPPTSCG